MVGCDGHDGAGDRCRCAHHGDGETAAVSISPNDRCWKVHHDYLRRRQVNVLVEGILTVWNDY